MPTNLDFVLRHCIVFPLELTFLKRWCRCSIWARCQGNQCSLGWIPSCNISEYVELHMCLVVNTSEFITEQQGLELCQDCSLFKLSCPSSLHLGCEPWNVTQLTVQCQFNGQLDAIVPKQWRGFLHEDLGGARCIQQLVGKHGLPVLREAKMGNAVNMWWVELTASIHRNFWDLPTAAFSPAMSIEQRFRLFQVFWDPIQV